MNRFDEESYVFLTPRDNEDIQYVKIIDGASPFVGVVLYLEKIKLRRRLFKKPRLDYTYSVITPPTSYSGDLRGVEFQNFVGDLIVDIWKRYFSEGK